MGKEGSGKVIANILQDAEAQRIFSSSLPSKGQ